MNVIIVGAPHSYTSVVAKHYIEVLGYKRSSFKPPPLEYNTYEPNYSYTDKNFRCKELAKDINSHDGYVYKLPMLPLAYDELLPLLKNKNLIFIFVIRNPMDIISSSLEKSGTKQRTANYFLLRIGHIYEKVLNSKIPHTVVMGESFVEDRKQRKHDWRISRKVLKIWEFFK
jgi:hypothetical protein